MRLGSEAYLKLMNQLRMLAINSNNLQQRHRMRDNMLRIITRIYDVTSVYICQHDFQERHSIVRNHFIGSRARHREVESDLGQIYPEDEMGTFVDWLYGDYTRPRILQIQDLSEDSAGYKEMAPYGVNTTVIVALTYQNTLWGYIEIWDSRRQRTYTEKDQENILLLAQLISDTILTTEG